MDLSLPIVLFSSTHRREIIEGLKAYGNIITIFEKPRLLAVTQDETVALAKVQFQQAVERALDLVATRRLCADLSIVVCESPTLQPKIVEIYVEESGNDSDFRVGGLIVAYPTEQAVSIFASQLRKANLVWGWHPR